MRCEKCSAEIAEGAKYCPSCQYSKRKFKAICPYCGFVMSPGVAKIKSSFGGILLAGFSHQHLFFKKPGETEQIIMRTRSEKEAFLCENCEGIYIPS